MRKYFGPAAYSAILCVLCMIGSVSFAASADSCNTSDVQPKPSFHHSSYYVGANSTVRDQVCNDDDKGLVYSWDKAILSRGVFHPLPAGECDQQSYPVRSDNVYMDKDAPIRYTQAGLTKRAAICTEDSSTASTYGRPLTSLLFTSFVGNDGRRNLATIQTDFVFDRDFDELQFRVRVTPSNIVVGLGSMQSLSGVLSDDEYFQTLLKNNSDPVGGFQYVWDVLEGSEDLKRLAPRLQKDMPLLLANRKCNVAIDVTLQLPREISTSMRQQAAAIYLFDVNRNLIFVGRYTAWLPAVANS